MKRTIGLILAIIMLGSVLGAPVYAVAADYSLEGAVLSGFSLSNNTLTATTAGATATWTINETGDNLVSLSLKTGSSVVVSIQASGFTYEKSTTATYDGAYELGCYDFDAGDTITVTDSGKTTVITGLELTNVNTVILDTDDLDKTDASVFSGWDNSSLKNYDGIGKTYIGTSCSAQWNIPNSVTGLTDIYYYYPENKNKGEGKSDSSATFTLRDESGNVHTSTFGGSAIPAGWHKVYTADFSKHDFASITISVGKDYNSCRLTAVKFVPNEKAYTSYLVTTNSFSLNGSWNVVNNSLGGDSLYQDKMMVCEDKLQNPASGSFEIENGNYYVYVHSLDYLNNNPATRTFWLNLNGTDYYKGDPVASDYKFGTHKFGNENTSAAPNDCEWAWEQAGYPSKTVTVTDGILDLKLISDKTYARTDAILITEDPFVSLSDNLITYCEMAEPLHGKALYEDEIRYPEEYLENHTAVSSEATLSNGNTSISFKLGTLPNGETSVQRKIEVNGTETVSYNDGLGFMVIRANENPGKLEEGFYPKFNTSYSYGTEEVNVSTYNVFRAGVPEWLIPDTLVQVDSNTVKMTATGTLADVEAIWTLADGDKEPKVTTKMTVHQNGEYSFGFFNNATEEIKNDVGFILVPLRWREDRMPGSGYLLPEAFSTTNHTQMTYKPNTANQEITLGVAVDEESVIHGRWTHNTAGYTRTDNNGQQFHIDYTDEQSRFAFNITGNDGGVLPAVFSPIIGSEYSSFDASDTYEFVYRPLSTVSQITESKKQNQGWYDCYNHVVTDLRNVYDFRENYFASMTDTIFNITDLIMDDQNSGWSEEMQTHYNIEDTYWGTNANGLIYMQNYLLTEDKEFLMERALPTMGTLLTRDSVYMNTQHSWVGRGEGPINKELVFSGIGMGNSTFEGAYLLSRGQMPVYRNISKKKEMLTKIESGGLGLKNPSDALWYDISRGDTSLSTAKDYADKYINNRSYALADNSAEVDEYTFINVMYSPHFQSQLDVYEATGEQAYLDGAIESARRFLPSLRTTDMPLSMDEMYTPDAEQNINEAKLWDKDAWFYNNERYRLGAIMGDSLTETEKDGSVKQVVKGFDDNTIPYTNTPYPFWVTSRVGLSIEQFTTAVKQNGNITMSTWAGDVLRLGYLSGDELMMDLARSSLVGRFSNFPGYYLHGYSLNHSLEDFPYRGFDHTTIYYHHIPVMLAALQDYLFSNAWVKSDMNIDFPYVRSQGYVWFNNRHYGGEAGKMYDEENMWPWLKEGTITISGESAYDAQQIDWLAGRKEGRAAFALTNASAKDQTVTVTFNSDLLVENGSSATIYAKDGKISVETVNNNQVTVTVPAKGILTVAVDGEGIHAPQYSKIQFPNINDGTDLDMGNSAIGLMYEGNEYTPTYDNNGNTYGYSVDRGYDVKGYALSLDNTAYMGYIFVGGRSVASGKDMVNKDIADGPADGIVKTTISWRFEDETEMNVVEDTSFPYELFIESPENKKIIFTVDTLFGNGEVKSLDGEYEIEPIPVTIVEGKENSHFDPIKVKLSAIGSLAPDFPTGIAGAKFCMLKASYESMNFGFDVTKTDSLKDCYLSGYVTAKDVAATPDVVESGYVLFDNVKIESSNVRASDGRLNFYVLNFATSVTNDDDRNLYDENGNYLGPKPNVIAGLANYDWSNLYIVNSANDNKVRALKDGNTYTISCNGAKQISVIIATFDGTTMTDVQVNDVIVSVNNSKTYTLNDNQKLFVWQKDLYQPLTMRPVLNVLNTQ